MTASDGVLSPVSGRGAAWTGRVLTGLLVLFLLMDGGIKLVPIRPVTDTLAAIGWPSDDATARGLGVLLIAATVLHLVPRTALLGAILLTGYLGGAVATHARIGSPLFTHTLFGVYLGLVLWAGYWLREPRLRGLLS